MFIILINILVYNYVIKIFISSDPLERPYFISLILQPRFKNNGIIKHLLY